ILGCNFSPNFYTSTNLLIINPLLVYLLLKKTNTIEWIVLIMLSLIRALLDIADGTVARYCKAGSKFGANFDIVTDAIFILSLTVSIIYSWSMYYKKLDALSITFFVVLLVINTAVLEQTWEELTADKRALSEISIAIKDNSIITTPVLVILTKLFVEKMRKSKKS
ncbi:MAG: CDP-alcohol phosphatidyltransferase family protein, partial [Candidatus Hodarchaeales archaeon]